MISKALLHENILPFVQKPLRYLGLEQGSIKKDIDLIPVKYALAFPDFYELGMSHIGMGIIYDVLNSEDFIACERVYLPYPDMISKLKENSMPLFSLESSENIKNFDIVGFSLQYELSYTNILLMLELSGIPILSSERGYGDPLICAGGPCAFNPLPLNDFIDFFIIGDGEITTVEVCKTVMDAKDVILKSRHLEKENYRNYMKELLSKIEGIYVPGFSKSVKKSIVYDLNSINYIKKPLIPLIEIIHSRFTTEIARGCSSGCRFCQAGYIYRPVRERKKEFVMDIIKNGVRNTGFEEISLSSLSTGDYSDINSLLDNLSDFTSEKLISMSFPSMRIGSLSENILKKTAEVKKTNFTLAPEAGTERLRLIINKNINRDDLLFEVANLSSKGFKTLKLYFMIGLPYERLSDIDGIGDLIVNIKKIAGKLNITVNLNNFVPKPHTPFQWFPMNTQYELNFKINYIKKILKPLSVNFRYQDPKISFIEGLISRGDSFTSKIIYRAYKFGAKFDSERKLFKYDFWVHALESFGNSGTSFEDTVNEYLYSQKDLNEPLPWDFIDILVDKNYLKNEFKKSFEQNRLTIYNFNTDNSLHNEKSGNPDFNTVSKSFNTGDLINANNGCENNKRFDENDVLKVKNTREAYNFITENCRQVCYLCGVCDFKSIGPVYSSITENAKIHKKSKKHFKHIGISAINISAINISANLNISETVTAILNSNILEPKNNKGKGEILSKLLIKYSKKEDIKYLGHHETIKILLRAFRTANLEISYNNSKFSPKPKVSYSNPIPFLSESDSLYMLITVKNFSANNLLICNELKNNLNNILPQGLKIVDVYNVPINFKIKDINLSLT